MKARGYQLPQRVERYLAALSKIYARDGNRELQELIVNAQTRVHEEWTTDNWNGGTFGHALFLMLPEALFLHVVEQKPDLQERLREDLNKLHNEQDEFFAEVFLELEDIEDKEWRQNSGLLLTSSRVVSPEAAKRIWADDQFRLFLSHKTEVKKETAVLKQQLRVFGISCFVAHEDIHPTKEWQNEIENALATMDGFVALMTKTFHESFWTDQEVGFALARNVPLIAVKFEQDPYGFIGKFQALSSNWDSAAEEIARLLLHQERMLGAYIQALTKCRNFDEGNRLGSLLKAIKALSEQQADEIITAYNNNGELRGSFAFNGTKPKLYGPGLLDLVNRFSKRTFIHGEHLVIEQAKKKRA